MPAFYLSLMPDTEKRLAVIAEEKGREIFELCEAAVDEAALEYFKGHDDDPAAR